MTFFFDGSPRKPPDKDRLDDDNGPFFLEFGDAFAEEMHRLLKWRDAGLLCEVVFWQDTEYGFDSFPKPHYQPMTNEQSEKILDRLDTIISLLKELKAKT